ncbi:MAG: methylated-DNA--[protein]-cysteine S-methyltransferase [Candidatus Gastranaerophilaceae bacterium]
MGTDFQNRVWKALMGILYGNVMSCSQVAAAICMPMAARAVGGACSANHLLIAATCHRVLRNDGGLGGFAVGLEPKRYLLKLENTLA